jgi:tRNA-2-methylthio-N6-dimethylallyladenosine synthase
MNKDMKKVFIRTLGCQMNVRDSEVIRGLLTNNGYRLTNNAEEADIIILNTCSVRQHAEDKVWSEVGRFSKTKRLPGTPGTQKARKPIIGIVGCMAQNYKDAIFERAPQVDFVVGPSDIHRIPSIIKEITGTLGHWDTGNNLFERKIWETDSQTRPEEIYHTGFYEDKDHAYIVISEGCSNFCSYCVVPYVRGPIHNRNYRDILKEIEGAVDKGIARITLLGQNVNAYQDAGRRTQDICCNKPAACLPAGQAGSLQPETVNFIKLLEMVNGIKGIKEFSFITSHPKDTLIELFQVMGDLEKLKKYLHLPVQSGSDRILKAMNRGYTRKFYLDLADKYRKIVKGAMLTTDIIVGFPLESEEDFQDTHNLVKDVQFNAAYIFKYSPRMNTEAAKLLDDVPIKEKEKRHALILELQKQISKRIR